MKKFFAYKLLIATILSISLFSSFVYGDEIQSSEPIIIHENPDQIQDIIISDDEIQSLISNIEDEEKKAILYEISITPVKEEVRLYNEDADLNSIGFTSEDPIKEYKKLAQLSNAELRKKLDVVREMNATLGKNEKVADNNFFNVDNSIINRPEDVSVYAVKSYTHTMEKTKKNILGSVLFGLRCKVDWNVSDGKITYLAPSTTRLYNSSYTYYGSLRGSEEVLENGTRGVVFKMQNFGLISEGYGSSTVTIAGNYFTDGTCAWNGEIN